MENILNKLVVFERPIQIGINTIYGLVINKKNEQLLIENGSTISDYIAYLVGNEFFLKNGGDISKDGKLWEMPDKIHTIIYNGSMERLLAVLMKDIVGYRAFEVDKIEWNDGEVDFDEGAPCFILNPSLIERYTNIEVGR